jgi:PEP-CTERM motif
MRLSFLLSAAASLAALAVPAQAVIPIYGNPGVDNPQNFSFFAGGSSNLRAWFVGKGGAVFTSRLGVIVNGVDRGFGVNNQTFALGQLHDYGKVTAGDILEYYINVADTGRTYSSLRSKNSDGVSHFFFSSNYTGGDFGIPLTAARPGSYFGIEDLEGGGDFNYTDLQVILRTGSIPEPASWALMIAGFGLVGAAARRRAKVRVTYA